MNKHLDQWLNIVARMNNCINEQVDHSEHRNKCTKCYRKQRMRATGSKQAKINYEARSQSATESRRARKWKGGTLMPRCPVLVMATQASTA